MPTSVSLANDHKHAHPEHAYSVRATRAQSLNQAVSQGSTVETGPGAAQHAGDIVQDAVRVTLILRQLLSVSTKPQNGDIGMQAAEYGADAAYDYNWVASADSLPVIDKGLGRGNTAIIPLSHLKRQNLTLGASLIMSLLSAHLEQLDVGVEQVALGDVDALDAQLVHELQDARRDDSLAAGHGAGERPRRRRLLQHDPIQLGHVPAIASHS